ncbi:MAG TPA: hypothetical protein VGM17_04215 [Rhizomicrobium sp.]|jgi:hypothetical protein
MVRKWGSAVVAAAMLASTAAYANDVQPSQGALAPGGAAGVHEAAIFGVPTATALLFTAAIIAVIAITVSNSGNSSSSKTTTASP